MHYYAALSQEAREVFWRQCCHLLEQEKEALAQPVVYTLAVDYFEEYTKHPGKCESARVSIEEMKMCVTVVPVGVANGRCDQRARSVVT